ncbi:hypothetical protein PXK00_07200 [Phaeobacter sp. QD34_3]|uniref:hypothetical protein n=1 Tax=unclassified Phaeobacter TaxID=2621772 RepID=UPI00237EEAB7|nr:MULTISPECIES: hypothetical protein [unclassified Phaeobacter]MDE4132891.1 hypothetical protein [Phaeobacter sp. QD34_3]MDE4136707.1 hypothetical protein [Phaeobacter sp. QD34_24]MDE4174106.1 hypothetical protein [Phaeobacter sp. PT47_59]
MIRLLAFLGLFALVAACGETQLNEPPEDLGAFKVRVAHVYTEKALKWPMSRDAEQSEWLEPMKTALEARLRRYDGAQEYDVAVTLEGFMLAPAGVPILFSPKSVAVVNVFVYDVAKKEFLADKHQMEIFESTTGESAIVGSGHSRTREEQIAGLSLNIADAVEEFLAEQHKKNGWFAPREAAAEKASEEG